MSDLPDVTELLIVKNSITQKKKQIISLQLSSLREHYSWLDHASRLPASKLKRQSR